MMASLTQNEMNDDGDRPMPSVNGPQSGKNKVMVGLVVFAAALVCVYFMVSSQGPTRNEVKAQEKAAAEAKQNVVTGRLPTLSPVPVPPPMIDGVAIAPAPVYDGATVPAPQGSPSTPVAVGADGKPEKPKWMVIRDRRMDGGISPAMDGTSPLSSDSSTQDASAQANALTMQALAGLPASGPQGLQEQLNDANEEGDAQDATASLGSTLQPTRTKGTVAALVFDRNFLLAKGSFLDCVLETKLDSTVPGMTSCILSRTIYSDNGKVVLAERGSRITGQYQGGMKQGQARIFVLWTRLQTPKGVVVDLDSPGTDALGASGLDGYVDTQFWKRFGGAMLLSLVDDVAAAAVQSQSEGANPAYYQNSQASAQEMAAEALKATANIPPVLRKNHGDHVNIYVARDLDFRSVYAVRAR